MRDITIGQYYPTDSVIHRLDPRVKLLGTLIFIVSLFVCSGIVGFVFSTAALAAVIIISGIPFRYLMRGIKGIYILVIITAVFNIFFTAGTPVVSWGMVMITQEGIRTAVFMSIRLIYLVLGTSIMTLSTTPNDLTCGIEKGCAFLEIFRVPVHEMALMMSIALRFIPILSEEADKIKKAQMSRGADFESGNILKRAKAMLPILVPLFVSAFRRAGELSLAMDSRCYHGGGGRTKLHPLKYERRDVVAYIVIAAFFTAAILIKVFVKTG